MIACESSVPRRPAALPFDEGRRKLERARRRRAWKRSWRTSLQPTNPKARRLLPDPESGERKVPLVSLR